MTKVTNNNIKANVNKPQILKEMSGDVRKYHKILLEYGGFKNITDAKKQTGNNTKEIYAYLFEQLNEFIIESNKQETEKHLATINQYKKELKEKNQEIKMIKRQQKEITKITKKQERPFNHLTDLASPITKVNSNERLKLKKEAK